MPPPSDRDPQYVDWLLRPENRAVFDRGVDRLMNRASAESKELGLLGLHGQSDTMEIEDIVLGVVYDVLTGYSGKNHWDPDRGRGFWGFCWMAIRGDLLGQAGLYRIRKRLDEMDAEGRSRLAMAASREPQPEEVLVALEEFQAQEDLVRRCRKKLEPKPNLLLVFDRRLAERSCGEIAEELRAEVSDVYYKYNRAIIRELRELTPLAWIIFGCPPSTNGKEDAS